MLLNEIVDFMRENNYDAFRSWGETLLDRVSDGITLYSYDGSKEYEFDLDEETDGVERLELLYDIILYMDKEVGGGYSSSNYMELLFEECKNNSDYYVLNDGDEVVHGFRTQLDKSTGRDLECITDVGTTYYGYLTPNINYIVEVDDNKIATFTFIRYIEDVDNVSYTTVFRFVEDEEPLISLKEVLNKMEEKRSEVMKMDTNNYRLEDVKEKVKYITNQIEDLTQQVNDIMKVLNSLEK